MKTILTISIVLLVFPLYAQVSNPSMRSADPLLRRIAHLEDILADMSKELDQYLYLQDSLLRQADKKQFDLAVGPSFQHFNSRPTLYYVSKENKLESFHTGAGNNLSLSILLTYQWTPKHHILLNLPLFTFTNNVGQATGLLQGQMAYGLGYGFEWKRSVFFTSINVLPYQRAIHALVKDRVFYQEPFSRIPIETLPTHTAYATGISIGAAFSLKALN